MISESAVSARLRSDLLDAMYNKFPLALSIDQLEDAVKLAYLSRDSYWLTSSCSNTSQVVAISCRPTVSTSVTVRSTTTSRITAWLMLRNVSVRPRNLNR